jgi:hypothetical protein
VSASLLTKKCDTFKLKPNLLQRPYVVKSQVSLDVFKDFLSALEDKGLIITSENFDGLSDLSLEFGFGHLSSDLAQWQESQESEVSTDDAVSTRLLALEEFVFQLNCHIAALSQENKRQRTENNAVGERISRLEGEFATMTRTLQRLEDSVKNLTALNVLDNFRSMEERLSRMENSVRSQSSPRDSFRPSMPPIPARSNQAVPSRLPPSSVVDPEPKAKSQLVSTTKPPPAALPCGPSKRSSVAVSAEPVSIGDAHGRSGRDCSDARIPAKWGSQHPTEASPPRPIKASPPQRFSQMEDVRVDASALRSVALKKVDAPAERPLQTAEEIVAAKKLAEEEPEQIPKELLPKTSDGRTHLDLIKAGAATLKKVDAPADRPLPTAEQIAAEKAAGGS